MNGISHKQVDHFREILIWTVRLGGRAVNTDLDKAVERIVRANAEWKLAADPFTLGPSRTDEARFAERVYFHPFVRSLLYSPLRDDSPIRILERNDVKSARVRLEPVRPGDGSDALELANTLTLAVHRVHLHLFSTGIAALVVEVSAHDLTLRQTEELLDRLRRVYRPYWKRDNRPTPEAEYECAHCPFEIRWLDEASTKLGMPETMAEEHGNAVPESGRPDSSPNGAVKRIVEPRVAAHWRYLLEPLRFDDGEFGLTHIVDERIPAMAYIAVSNPRQLSEGDFIRLGYFNEGGTSSTLPYSSEFLKGFVEDHCYDRYWDPNTGEHGWMDTRYICMGYSFVMVGSTRAQFFTDGDAGALAHFRFHYFQLGLLAHVLHASLLGFTDELAQFVEGLKPTGKPSKAEVDENHAALERLSIRFSSFVARFWFPDVTNQIQGKELFRLWIRHLGAVELYEELKDEIRLAREVISERQQRQEREITLNLTKVATIGLYASIVIATLGMGLLMERGSEYLTNRIGLGWQLGEWALLSVVLGVALFSARWMLRLFKLEDVFPHGEEKE